MYREEKEMGHCGSINTVKTLGRWFSQNKNN